MRIIEVISGPFGTDTLALNPPDDWKQRHTDHSDDIPQVGYGIKVGKQIIPTPKSDGTDSKGTVDSVIGG